MDLKELEKDSRRKVYSTFTTAWTGEYTCCHYDERHCLEKGLSVWYTMGIQKRQDAVEKNQRILWEGA